MRLNSDVAFGAGAIIVAAFLYYQTTGLPPSVVPNSIGSAAFPRLLLALIGALGATLVIRGVLRTRRAGAGEAAAVPLEPGPQGGYVRPIVLLGGLVLYLAALPVLGYFPATALLIIGTLILFEERRPLHIFIGTAGFLTFSFIVFDLALGVLLPRGTLFFEG